MATGVVEPQSSLRRPPEWLRPTPFTYLGVLFPITLHLVWAVCLAVSVAPIGVTGLHILTRLFPNRLGLIGILVFVAVMAGHALIYRGERHMQVLMLVPQQVVLGISAAGAVRAMLSGIYADGTFRGSAFVIADQSTQVMLLLAHSATIIWFALRSRWPYSSL